MYSEGYGRRRLTTGEPWLRLRVISCFLLGGKQNRCGQDMEKIWRKSAGSELMGNQGQECSSQNAFEADMEKEPRKRNHASKGLCVLAVKFFSQR